MCASIQAVQLHNTNTGATARVGGTPPQPHVTDSRQIS